jgi:prenyl protein peptidase
VVVRNLLCAPVTEEVVFRACVCRVLLSASIVPYTVILFSPIFFGVAHIHHIIEAVCFRRHDLRSAIASQSFQMLYTTLFGNLACLLYFSTGSLVSAIVLHTGCNYFGVPRFNGAAFRLELAALDLAVWVVGTTIAVSMVVWMACTPFQLS